MSLRSWKRNKTIKYREIDSTPFVDKHVKLDHKWGAAYVRSDKSFYSNGNQRFC